MKTKTSSRIRNFSAATIAAVVIAISSSAHAQTWDGGGTTTSWGTADNWDPNVLPAFNTTTDLIFNTTVKPDLNIGAARTIRSITFGADIDSDFVINFRNFASGAGSAAAALTMQAASGNATLTVDSGATGNISYGWIGTNTAGGSLILSSDLDIVHNGSGNLTFSRQITGASGFTKSGNGTMVVAQFNTNSFTGAANFNEGRAIFGNTNTAGGDLNSASAVNFGGGILEIRTTNTVNKTLTSNTTVSSASTLAYNNTTNATQTLIIQTGTMTLNAGLTVQNISSNTTLGNGISINRVITGNGSLTVDTYNNIASSANNYTLGRVSLSQDNSAWSGNLTIARGTLTIQGTSLTGQQTGSGILTIGTEGDSFGAGLSMFSSANNTTSFLVNNDVVVTSGGFRSIKGGNTDHGLILNGNVTLNENSVLNLDHEMSSTRSIALNGNITGLGGLSITRNGGSATSSVTLTGTNNYLGATTIASGARLFIGAGGTTGSVTSNIVNDGTLIFNRSNASSYDGAITGTGTFTKTGAGALTLDGTSNYGGNTTVSTGALIIDGAVTTSATIVASGARIGGDGAITGGLSLASGAQFVFSLTATLDVSGAVTLDNSFGVGSLVNADGTAINWSSVGLGTYALINTASTFNNITNFGFDNRSVNIGGSGKDVYFTNGSLQLVVIPETSTWAIVGIGLFGMVVFHRIRRRSRGV